MHTFNKCRCLAIVAAAIFCLFLLHATTVVAALPNVILCMGDDHGWDETAYNGHPHLITPVLDEMAASGLRLDRFFSASPVCSPTRGSIITGRHPNRYGVFNPNWSIRPEEVSIAQIMAQRGYRCGHFGKWHLGPVKQDSPTNPGAMGFHEWLSHDNFFEMDPQFSRNGGPPQQFKGEGSEIVVDEAIRFIDQAQQEGSPFFAVLWFGSPHEPYSGLQQDLALYDDLPAEYQDRQVTVTSMETGRPVKRPLREVLRERYAEITAMDRAIGKLRDHLEAAQMRANTLLWYCGDNGVPREGAVTTPLRGQKGLVYDGGIRVPCVIEWPALIGEPRTSDVISVTSDMLPTICQVIGQQLPDRPLDGISLKPLFDGQMKQRPTPICFWNFPTAELDISDAVPYIEAELQQGTTPLAKLMGGVPTRSFRNFHYQQIDEKHFGGARAILDNRYKLVLDGQRVGDRELFDVLEDPAEQQNLIDSKPQIATDLQKQLRKWQESVLHSLTGADYR